MNIPMLQLYCGKNDNSGFQIHFILLFYSVGIVWNCSHTMNNFQRTILFIYLHLWYYLQDVDITSGFNIYFKCRDSLRNGNEMPRQLNAKPTSFYTCILIHCFLYTMPFQKTRRCLVFYMQSVEKLYFEIYSFRSNYWHLKQTVL